MPFTDEQIDLVDRATTVRIETSRPGGPIHRTIIWAVVDGRDVFIRSWRGAGARWYREASAHRDVALHFGKHRLPGMAIAATDPESVARASAALLRKYAGDPVHDVDGPRRDPRHDTAYRGCLKSVSTAGPALRRDWESRAPPARTSLSLGRSPPATPIAGPSALR